MQKLHPVKNCITKLFKIAKNDIKIQKGHILNKSLRHAKKHWIYSFLFLPFLYTVGFFFRCMEFMISDMVSSFCALFSAVLRLLKLHFSAMSCNNGSASFTSKNSASLLSSSFVFCF